MSARLDALAAALGETRHDRGEHYLTAQCDHAAFAAAMRAAGVVADALIVDAPYSERTHAGHDDGTASANRVISWAKGRASRGLPVNGDSSLGVRVARTLRKDAERREIDYPAWTGADVDAFVTAWADRTGWLLSLTDHVLAREWERACGAADLYAFAPIACIENGSRVRLDGTGPPQWATQLVPARPRSRAFIAAWHAKRWAHDLAPAGGYSGGSEKKPVTGGKPLWLMRAIVGDYSAPGDLVVDPCMGGGTTPVAAIELGRIAIGCEPDAGRYEIARARCAKARPQLRMALDVTAEKRTQSALDLSTEEP